MVVLALHLLSAEQLLPMRVAVEVVVVRLVELMLEAVLEA